MDSTRDAKGVATHAREVLQSTVSNLLQKVDNLEKMMFYINSREEVMKHKYVLTTFIEVRQSLLSYSPAISINYREPKRVVQPSGLEQIFLCEVYKKVHESLWDVRTKLKLIRSEGSSTSSSVKLVEMIKLIKAARDVR
jgi:hypothetical protein